MPASAGNHVFKRGQRKHSEGQARAPMSLDGNKVSVREDAHIRICLNASPRNCCRRFRNCCRNRCRNCCKIHRNRDVSIRECKFLNLLNTSSRFLCNSQQFLQRFLQRCLQFLCSFYKQCHFPQATTTLSGRPSSGRHHLRARWFVHSRSPSSQAIRFNRFTVLRKRLRKSLRLSR